MDKHEIYRFLKSQKHYFSFTEVVRLFPKIERAELEEAYSMYIDVYNNY